MRKRFLISIALVCILGSLLGQSISLEVNNGPAPIIDGTIDRDEWAKASKLDLAGGKVLYCQISDNALYIAVKGASGGFTSLGLGSRSYITIFHTSTGLITARYACQDEQWELIHDFAGPLTGSGVPFPRNEIRLGDVYKQAQIRQFQWYASLIEMNDPSETEFQISLSLLPEDDMYLSVVFFQIGARTQMAKLPGTLSDGMTDSDLIQGSAREGLHFDPESWVKLTGVRSPFKKKEYER